MTKPRAGGFSVSADPMLLYFLSTIDVRTKWFSGRTLDPAETAILEEIKSRTLALKRTEGGAITECAAWTEAYFLERMMALLEPPETLLPEIRRRVDEAAAERVAAEPILRASLLKSEALALDESKDPPALIESQVPALRSLLLEVLDQIHWTNQRKFYARPIQKDATKKLLNVALIAGALFVAPYAYLYYSTWRDADYSISSWGALPLYTAMISGLFGACFSRLQYMQANAEQLSLGDLKNAREWTSILLRLCVGMSGALIVFFFLQSGIVAGSLFPEPHKLGLQSYSVPLAGDLANSADRVMQDAGKAADAANAVAPPPSPAPGVRPGERPLRLMLPRPALALLVIWCFLAGFSERLVPNILSSTETSFQESSKSSGKK